MSGFFSVGGVRGGSVFFALLLALTAANAPAADPAAPPAPPWALPGFHGDGADVKPPAGAVEAPGTLDARALFDLVMTCYPTRSWWQPELALQARASGQKRSQEADTTTGQVTSTSGSYAALILTVPLYSAADIDKERERERSRRGDVAGAVGKLEKLLADRGVLRRELGIWRAVETRSAKRVATGVAETQEQINAIRSVADTEGKLRANRADLTAQTLALVGMCADRTDVEGAITRAIGEARP